MELMLGIGFLLGWATGIGFGIWIGVAMGLPPS